jgi:hypothetical protein
MQPLAIQRRGQPLVIGTTSMAALATLAALATGLGGCASPRQPDTQVPPALVPAGEKAVERLAARGVQIYQCRSKVDSGGKTVAEWSFVAPEAELFDGDGKPAGKHYAGPHWEAPDGSKIIGTVKARADAPSAGAIPWLLLTARSVAGDGRFAKASSVQRINTSGGVAPADGCDSGRIGANARVNYTADYVLFTPA